VLGELRAFRFAGRLWAAVVGVGHHRRILSFIPQGSGREIGQGALAALARGSRLLIFRYLIPSPVKGEGFCNLKINKRELLKGGNPQMVEKGAKPQAVHSYN
jgi:hypothetical protein